MTAIKIMPPSTASTVAATAALQSLPTTQAAANSSTTMLKGGGKGEEPVIGNGSFGGGKAFSMGLAPQQANSGKGGISPSATAAGASVAVTAGPPRGLKRYKILGLIGDGTYGLVYMALTETREKVAIKTMKRRYHSWDEVMDLREVKSLKKLHHPNVVKLKEVIRENSRLYFVFEYVKGDLLGLMRERAAEPFTEAWIRNVVFQVLQGLAYMHRLGFFHRDLKPENILAAGSDTVKIADFGLAREIRSAPPFTDYVSTRWYRAPEVLLRSTNYSSPIDIWAVGCITSELYTKRPLFPGTSEIDQLYKVCSVLGTPSRGDWSDGFVLANNMSFHFPNFSQTHLSQVLGPQSTARTVSFVSSLLPWNPSWRSTAQEALKHSYFRVGRGYQGLSATPATAGGIPSTEVSPAVTRRRMDADPVAGSQVSMVQKPGRNYAPNKPVTIADLSSSAAASEVDYERERQNLKFKKKHDGAITDAAARNNQSSFDEDESDIGDLISTFGLSPEVGKKQQKSNLGRISKKADGNTSDESNSGGGGGATLKDKLPKFKNFDLNGSVEDSMTTPRRFSKHPSSWGQKESLGLHRLSFGINTKYTSVFGKSKINATTNKGTVAAVIASSKSEDNLNLATAADSTQKTRMPFSTNRTTAATNNGFVGTPSSSVMTGKDYLRNGGSGTSMPVMHALQPRNLTTYRSLSDFGGVPPTKVDSTKAPKNGFLRQSPLNYLGNGSVPKPEQERPKIQVRTNWAAKYLK